MIRKTLFIASVFAIVDLFLLSSEICSFAGCQSSSPPYDLLVDNFESYAFGTFPSSGGWQLINNGWGAAYQVVDNAAAVSGTKSFKLEGAEYMP